MVGTKVCVILGLRHSGISVLAKACDILGADFGEHVISQTYRNELLQNIHEDIFSYFNFAKTHSLPFNWHKHSIMKDFKRRLISVLSQDFSQKKIAICDSDLAFLLPLYIDVFSEMSLSVEYLVLQKRRAFLLKTFFEMESLSEFDALAYIDQAELSLNTALNSVKYVRIDFEEMLENPQSLLQMLDTLAIPFTKKQSERVQSFFSTYVPQVSISDAEFIEELSRKLGQSHFEKTILENESTQQALHFKDLPRLENEVKKLQHSLHAKEQSLISLKGTILPKKNEQIKELEFTLKQKNMLLEDLKAKVESQSTHIQDQQEKVTSLLVQIESLKSSQKEKLAQLQAQLTETKSAYTQQIQSLYEELATERSTYAQLAKDVIVNTNLQERLSASESRCEKLSQDIEKIKDEYEKYVHFAKIQQSQASGKVVELQNQLKELSQKYAEQQQFNKEYQRKLGNFSQSLSQGQETDPLGIRQQYEKQLLHLGRILGDKENELQNLQLELQDVKRTMTFRALSIYQRVIDKILHRGSFLRNMYDVSIGYAQRKVYTFFAKPTLLPVISLTNPDVLFINNEESRTGGPRILFELANFCKNSLSIGIVSMRKGSMHEEFTKHFSDIIYPDEYFSHLDRFSKAREVLKHTNPKLVYANTMGSIEYAIEAKKLGIPVIAHVHDMRSGFFNPNSLPYIKDFKRSVDMFIVVSQATYDFLVNELKFPQHKVELVPAFVNSERVQKLSEKFDADISSNELLVVGCGLASERKGTDLFIQTYEKVRKETDKVSFYWVGDYKDFKRLNPSYFPKYEHLFLGEKNNPYPYLKKADLFYLSSREDPFPLVVLESMALQKPVITFEGNGGSKEQLGDSGYYAPFEDCDSVVRRILILLEKRQQLENRGNQLFRRQQELDSKKHLPKLYQKIRKVLRRSNHHTKKCYENRSKPALRHEYLVSVIFIVDLKMHILPVLQSIQQQEHQHFEVIVAYSSKHNVADEIKDRFAEDSRFIFIFAPALHDYGRLMQMSLRQTKGEYVTFAQVDTVFTKTAFSQKMLALQQTSAVLVYNQLDLVGKKQAISELQKSIFHFMQDTVIPDGVFSASELLESKNCILNLATVMIRGAVARTLEAYRTNSRETIHFMLYHASLEGQFLFLKKKLTRWHIVKELQYMQKPYLTHNISFKPMLSLPPKSFVITFFERSGSTYLTTLLNSHPDLTCYGELFDVFPESRNRTVQEKVSKKLLYDSLSSSANATGFKFKYPEQEILYPEIFEELLSHRNDLKVILLYRKNILKQALSKFNQKQYAKKGKPGNVEEESDTVSKIYLHKSDIDWIIKYCKHVDSYLSGFFARRKLFAQVKLVAYEDLVTDLDSTLADICQFLGVSREPKLHSSLLKIIPDDLTKVIENYDDFEYEIKKTAYRRFLS